MHRVALVLARGERLQLCDDVRGPRDLRVGGGVQRRRLGGEHENALMRVCDLGWVRGVVDRLEDGGGVRLPLFLRSEDLLENADLDRGLDTRAG